MFEAWMAWTLSVAAVLVGLAITGYSIRAFWRRPSCLFRARLFCPALEREADVEFKVRDGVPVNVRRCSLSGEIGDLTCGKLCLHLRTT